MQNKGGYSHAPAAGTATGTDGSAFVKPQRIPIDPDATGNSYGGADSDSPLIAVDNDDPLRRRGVHGRKSGIVVRLFRRITHKITPEEQALLTEQKKRKLLQQVLEKDARTWERAMVNCLTRLGYEHTTKKNGEIVKRSKVRFDYIATEPDAIHYHVDLVHLPDGVSTDYIKTDEVASNLGFAVQRRVTCRWTIESGIWYTVERASGRAGIRNHVMISEMWEAMPASANALTIPIGVTHNSRFIYQSIGDMPHAMVAGTTGAGKSNFIHAGINTLIRRNSPTQVQMILIDLKGGLEFSRYVGVPHLLQVVQGGDKNPEDSIAPDGIVTERDKVQPLLAWLRVYGEKRMKMLLDSNASNIGEYNARRKTKRMPFLVVWIDEWADVRLSKGGKEAEDELVNLVQRMRAVGIHFILATQIPKSEVITGLIKGNLPCRFAFSVPNLHASMAIIDSSDAVGLEPTGRCIMQYRGNMQLQTPYISKETVQQTIQGAASGQYGEEAKTHDVTPREIMEWSIAENNGWLQYKVLFAKYRDRGISRAELTGWLQDWEDNVFTVGTSNYQVVQVEGTPGNNRVGRRLISVDEPEQATDPLVEEVQ